MRERGRVETKFGTQIATIVICTPLLSQQESAARKCETTKPGADLISDENRRSEKSVGSPENGLATESKAELKVQFDPKILRNQNRKRIIKFLLLKKQDIHNEGKN